MKQITRLMTILICVITVFSASADGTVQYCQKELTSASNNQTIQLTCQETSSGNYEMRIEASTAIAGFGGSFFEINGGGGNDIRNQTITYSNENKTASIAIVSNIAPKLYTPLYILFPGEEVFTANDIKWDISCSGEAIVDLNLSDITVDGTTISGFSPSISSYNIKLPAGTVNIPVVAATAKDTENTTVVVTQADALPGTSTITVMENGNNSNTKEYVIHFKIDNSGNNTECAGTSDEASQGSFTNGYTYEFSTDASNKITAKFTLIDPEKQTGLVAEAWLFNPNFSTGALTNNNGVFTGTFEAGESSIFKIACKFAYAGGMAVTKTFEYTVGQNCGGTAATNLDLETLMYDGVSVEDFSNKTKVYNVSLPTGTTNIPTVTATAVDSENTIVEITQATEIPGSAIVKVTDKIDNSRTSEFQINFTIYKPNTNTEYEGTSTDAAEGTFTKGYRYEFIVDKELKITTRFKLLDDKEGVVAYAHTRNPDFAEVQLTPVEDGYFSKTFENTGLKKFNVAVKFAYAGGLVTSQPHEFDVTKPSSVQGIINDNGSMLVYPTHVTDFLNIKTDMNVKAVYIHSTLGNLVKKEVGDSNNITIGVSDLQNGLYIVTVEMTDGKRYSQKILKY